MKIKFTVFLLGILVSQMLNAQTSNQDWQVQWHYPKVFIENKGQFDGRDRLADSQIEYAIDHGSLQVFFTKEGFTYRLDNKVKNRNRKKGERPKLLVKSDYIYVKWIDANPEVNIIAEDVMPDYHTYSMLGEDRESYSDIRNIKGFKKITYTNLYPNIDVVFEFHPSDGIKYSVILKPGSDATQLKMGYTSDRELSIDTDGNLKIKTLYGDITEKAPLTFYENNTNAFVNSSFKVNGTTISFDIDSYDATKTLIIDPWVQTPSVLSNSNGVWELDIDAAGNVYIIGGDMPMRLQKYSATGNLLWTYNTPWDTANFWLGTLTVDYLGNSFITAGSSARLQKVNTSGGMEWGANGGMNDEYWMITFNCDKTKLIVGGTRLSVNPLNPNDLSASRGVIFDININNGSVLSLQNVDTTRPGPMGMFDEPVEVRALTSSKSGRYYYLTLESVGAINQNFNVCTTNDPVFHTSSGYVLSYKSEDYRPNNGNAGNRIIRTSPQFLYTQNGSHVQKRSLIDGSVITTVPIDGGISTAQMGFNTPGNGGIAIDTCGNVYIGSSDRIIKYNADLVYLTHTDLPFRVSDIAIGINGEVVVCGTTGTSASTSRTGYIQSINMTACPAYSQVCCLTTVCPVGPFCHDDPAVTLVTEISGGTFSGAGVDPLTGVFDPAIAGPGTHIITYTLPCGSSDIVIVVNYCVPLSVCAETNGDITVSGGIGPYIWEEFLPASSTPITNQAECVGCGFQWVPLMNQCLNGVVPVTTCDVPAHFAQFATGTTVTPTVNYPLQVTDSQGNMATINDFSLLDECLPCPPISISTSNVVNAACVGGSDGSFTAEASGGTAPYSYTLTLAGATIATFPNVSGTQDFTGLAAGTYAIEVTDAAGCPGTANITIGENNFIISASSNSPICEGQTIIFTANGGSVYTWSGPEGFSSNVSNPTITNAALVQSGTYSVTISSPPCIDSASINVIVNPAPIADAGIDQTITYGQSITLQGSGGGIYAWTPIGSLDNPNIANPVADPTTTTDYILIVTNAFDCSASDTVTITVEVIEGDLFVPNIFSPSSTNPQNNHVFVYGPNIKEMKFFIYNRWGEKVFETTNQAEGWDGTYQGKPCDPAVFTYYLEVIYFDDSEEKLTGNISLVK
ncbi:MAG: gliding motility-associated C-terminal domain-containing protein [Bacteroidales bacterium]|nr:gliding motility-associated C-terminal domain-containing protein [Bacteroidales bacterium]